jgi:hypothetical protein
MDEGVMERVNGALDCFLNLVPLGTLISNTEQLLLASFQQMVI